MTAIPFTPTITLNLADHPVIFFLEPEPDRLGEFRWAWRTLARLNASQRARQEVALWLTRALYQWVLDPASPAPDMREVFDATGLADAGSDGVDAA
jgi:hypothetical protein